MYRYALFDLFGTLVDDQGKAMAGAAALLAGLPPDRWAIVTSCPRGMALALIARAGLPTPRVLVSADDVERGKPAPDCYLAAAAAFGAEPKDCIAIEDSTGGIAAARAAGMDVIAVGRGLAIADVRLELTG